ncbi:hypothetical protein SAMN05216215_1018160 [Saccharopolyspora shandongensis]|uniref:Uncharacterized protein n=1 Tax=Saccharopolyspora shandongensis TaxID=418495 RepID=A0A1H3GI03_9PSEU|nr:hypothetical protein SAMN05216215_1018160 [Saccharopolyspora shandongensis]
MVGSEDRSLLAWADEPVDGAPMSAVKAILARPTDLHPRLRPDDPKNVQHDNTLRAQWAAHALAARIEQVHGSDDQPLETVVEDLVADLWHFCDAFGINFEEIIEKGAERHADEAAGEI